MPSYPRSRVTCPVVQSHSRTHAAGTSVNSAFTSPAWSGGVLACVSKSASAARARAAPAAPLLHRRCG
eukprot:10700679-Prorocentrum_lima.AAC.1